MLSQDFMAIMVPGRPHFILQLCICDFPTVYVWKGVNDMSGDHRLRVERKLCKRLRTLTYTCGRGLSFPLLPSIIQIRSVQTFLTLMPRFSPIPCGNEASLVVPRVFKRPGNTKIWTALLFKTFYIMEWTTVTNSTVSVWVLSAIKYLTNPTWLSFALQLAHLSCLW